MISYAIELIDISKREQYLHDYLIVTRVAIILWINLAVMPAARAFDAIEAELEHRGIEL
jgi:hypothetical protein